MVLHDKKALRTTCTRNNVDDDETIKYTWLCCKYHLNLVRRETVKGIRIQANIKNKQRIYIYLMNRTIFKGTFTIIF